MFTCAVVLGGVAVKPADAQTGERGSELAGEFLTAASVLADSVEHSCQVLGPTLWSPEAHEVGHCRDGGCSAAGTALHHAWVACQYERRWVLPASGSDPTDTVAENEVVLYRRSPRFAVRTGVNLRNADSRPCGVKTMSPRRSGRLHPP